MILIIVMRIIIIAYRAIVSIKKCIYFDHGHTVITCKSLPHDFIFQER